MKKPTIFHSLNDAGLATLIANGGIGVMPSDTLYGVMCSAINDASIERLYKVKKRDPTKPCVILASSLEQLMELEGLDQNTLLNAEKYWPGAVTVVVQCKAGYMPAVHRGTKTIACRVPDNAELRSLLEITGPIVAPSANPEGARPASDLHEAQAYFGDDVDFYVDVGKITNDEPSTLIQFDEDGLATVLRQGAVKVNEPS